MQTDQMVFEGSETEQQLAREIWLALRMMGASYAETAPIRQPLPALASFFARLPLLAGVDDPAAAIDAALSKSSAVFLREEREDGTVVFATTKSGQAPMMEMEDLTHTFKARLTEPEPVRVVEQPPEAAPAEEAAPVRVADVWLRPTEGAAGVLGVEEEEEEAAAEEAMEAVSMPAEAAEEVAAAVPAAPEAPEAPEAPVAEAIEPAPPVEIDRDQLREALRARLEADLRLVPFGNEWYLDEGLQRLSRGDFRRIRDYLLERGEPLTDDELMTDVFNRRPSDRDYAVARFGLDQRLSKEKREFEFVGTSQARLWTTSGLPPITASKRKPQEIGQDYRFLLESTEVVSQEELGTQLEHSLTFYEYENGLLPLDARFAAFFPAPYIEEQRTAVLRFEVPQLYTAYLVELRYPTASRGGFISGLDQFYAENLVPGARIVIERTDNDGRYLLRFEQTGEQERRLLHLDERRNRFVFRPVTFYCAVDEDMLLSDTKFPGLNNSKALEDRERRRPEVVVRTTFERVGEQVGEAGASRFFSLFDDLYAAANIERPFTREYLRSVLDSGPEFERDESGDAYFYEPGKAQ